MGIFDSTSKRVSSLEHEVLSNPTPQNMVQLAESYARLEEWARALDVAKRAIERFPDSEKCALTYQHISKVQLSKEISDLNRAIRTAPTQQHYERLATMYMTEMQDRNKALEVSMEGLTKFPSSDGLHVICAQVRMDRFHTDFAANDASEAIRHAEYAMKMNPESQKALYILGRLESEAGALDRAKPHLDRYLKMNSGDEPMRQLLKLVEAHITESVSSVDDALGEIETRHALSTVGYEMLNLFDPGKQRTQITISPAKLESFLRGFESMHGYKCSMVMSRDGTLLAGHSRGMVPQDKFVNLVQNIYRQAEDASRKMDLGDFRDGEIKTTIGTVKIAEWKSLVIGLLADSPAKPEDFNRAVDKFHNFVV